MNDFLTRYKIVYLIVAVVYFALALWDPLKHGIKLDLFFIVIILLINVFPRKYDNIKSILLIALLAIAIVLYFSNIIVRPFFQFDDAHRLL